MEPSDLIEQLQQATAPSATLDASVALASGMYVFGSGRRSLWDTRENPWRLIVFHSTKELSAKDAIGLGLPAFTSSLDAALSLVPEGWTRSVDATEPTMGIDVELYAPRPHRHAVIGSHSYEAIATCIAALRAQFGDAATEEPE